MTMCNYNVTETEYGLSFDEEFNPTCFNISFQVDAENDVSPSGWVTFEPRKGLAVMAYYGHPEDLMPSTYDFALRDFSEGYEVLVAFSEYKLGDLYRAAKAFTTHVVEAHEAEIERIWNEYIKERA